MSGVLVLGAGGHGKVVADILLCQHIAVLGFLDDDPALWGTECLGLPVLGPIADIARYAHDGLVPGTGSNRGRKEITERLGASAVGKWRNAIHPSATVAPSASLGLGVVIAAGAVVNPDSKLGDHVIVNTGATVDHDCFVGSFAHIAPGVNLAGHVSVGIAALVGVGAAVAPGCRVGEWATVGAGSVVVRDIPDGVIAKGVPARWQRTCD